jgi:hypothetical protein
MIKLPSLNSVAGSLIATVKRFPLPVLCALKATYLLIYLTHVEFRYMETSTWHQMMLKGIMCCAVGMPLLLGLALLSENRNHSLKQKIVLQVIGLALIIAYFFSIGDIVKMDIVHIVRYLLFCVTTHLFVSFAPFFMRGQLNGFWQYNKALFLRILLAAVYTVVLYGGLSLALWSIDELLHIKIGYKVYIYTWITLSCLFNTVFFLAGLPKNLAELDNDTSYLKGLKVFTQYVLLPLVTLYLLILYAYIGKILIEWKLPKGLVSYLVIGYSVAGILSLLLIYPIRHNEDSRWIRIFSRWFYLALFPLIIMLGISIFNRVAEYGITENRYFILVLALWLACIASYFLLSKNENIKIIPISLAFIAFFSSFGPWGAFYISEHSQMKHLEELLTANKILVNGKIDSKNQHPVKSSVSDEIWSVVEYLNERKALNMLNPWLNKVKIDTMKYGQTSAVIDEMHLVSENNKDYKTIYFYRNNSSSGYTSLSSIDIKGFETYSTFYGSYYRVSDTTEAPDTTALGYFMIGNDSLSIYPQARTNLFEIRKKRKAIATMDMKGFFLKLDKQYDTSTNSYHDIRLTPDKLSLDVECDSITLRFMFKTANIEKNQDKVRITNIDADVLSKHK